MLVCCQVVASGGSEMWQYQGPIATYDMSAFKGTYIQPGALVTWSIAPWSNNVGGEWRRGEQGTRCEVRQWPLG